MRRRITSHKLCCTAKGDKPQADRAEYSLSKCCMNVTLLADPVAIARAVLLDVEMQVIGVECV